MSSLPLSFEKLAPHQKLSPIQNQSNACSVPYLILSSLDYCNAVLANATAKQLKPLKNIQNDAVRFIFNLKLREHVTPYFVKLHFLPIRYLISFKHCLLAFNIANETSPQYLSCV